MITKKYFNKGINKNIKLRLNVYKKWRKPKYAMPFSKFTSFVCCYGELNAL